MTTETSAPAVGSTPAPAEDLTPRDLSNLFAQARQAPESAPPATEPEEDSAKADNAAPQTEDPGKTTETTEPAEELPPIEPPRSWTQAEKERFQSLPRETQEYLHNREQERERDFRTRQNEVAEQRKAIEAERQKAEQARQQYEAKLPALMQALHDTSPFSDIKSMADVEKLQAEDPFRFQQFQVYQWKMQGVQAELQEAEQRKANEAKSQWEEHARTEGEKFTAALSDADKAKIADFMAAAPKFLEERGFTNQELSDMWSGKEKLSLRDHRVQALILDGLKYRDVLKAKVVAAPKPAPSVQRPGTSKPPGEAVSETIKNLSSKLERTGDTKDLAALIGAYRRA